MRFFRLFSVVAMLVTLLVTTFAPGVLAASNSTGTMVATGLNSPRGIWVNDDGSMYVAESGNGGSEVIPPPAGSPTSTLPIMRGYSGQITRIGADGTKSVIAANLPSAGDGEGYVGPEGLIVANGYIWVVTGAITSAPTRLKNDGSVLRIDPNTGAIKLIADISANELAHNPQAVVPHRPDSDPYGITLGSDKNLYVTDAAGNDLYLVDPTTGAYRIVTHFAGIPITHPNPERGGKMENDPVPTGVVGATDGRIFVGLLGGGAPMPGLTKVEVVAPDGTVKDYGTGLTYVTGVTIAPDGNLYAVEMTGGLDLTAHPPMLKPGDVVRIMSDGSKQVVASGLSAPSSVDFDRAGNMFVTVNSGSTNGGVLRFDNVAPGQTPTTPLPGTGIVPGTQLFPQTGFSLSGTFLKFWLDNGGLSVFGYPINSEQPVNGKIVQWLERERLELHPENAAPYNVELGLLGAEALAEKGINWKTLPKVNAAPTGCMYFEQTNHSLCGAFLNYWQSQGLDFGSTPATLLQKSIALFGYPISEPKIETNSSGQTVLTQWFERARLEYYPANPEGYKVLLGRLGAEVFQHQPQP